MFVLIDSVLPFEACLYYQVIPLAIESNYLNVGMVDVGDTIAAEYVRRQVSYIKYSVVMWKITSDWHRQMLSKYLSYASKAKQKRIPPDSTAAKLPAASRPAPLIDGPIELKTFIVDSPEHLTDWTMPSAAASRDSATPSLNSHQAAPDVDLSPAPADRVTPPVAPSVSSPDALNRSEPLALNLNERDVRRSLVELGNLPPPSLMNALLAKVLNEGIGRLYFERGPQQGRILWSRDGVVQSALDSLSLELFQSVINEFKRFTHLPLLPIQTSKQVELERLYNHERVLIRFRMIKGSYGEEATLQVLRGAALKFYQQQQIDQLGRDALGVAQDLQQRVREIRDRGRQAVQTQLNSSNRDTLAAITQLLKDIESQIEMLLDAETGGEKASEH